MFCSWWIPCLPFANLPERLNIPYAIKRVEELTGSGWRWRVICQLRRHEEKIGDDTLFGVFVSFSSVLSTSFSPQNTFIAFSGAFFAVFLFLVKILHKHMVEMSSSNFLPILHRFHCQMQLKVLHRRPQQNRYSETNTLRSTYFPLEFADSSLCKPMLRSIWSSTDHTELSMSIFCLFTQFLHSNCSIASLMSLVSKRYLRLPTALVATDLSHTTAASFIKATVSSDLIVFIDTLHPNLIFPKRVSLIALILPHIYFGWSFLLHVFRWNYFHI